MLNRLLKAARNPDERLRGAVSFTNIEDRDSAATLVPARPAPASVAGKTLTLVIVLLRHSR
jgi:hypothetical protein